MAFTVAAFTSSLANQGARASLFEITLTGAVLTNAVTADADAGITGIAEAIDTAPAFKFSCRASTIPGMTVTPIPVVYFGREVKTPGELEFPDWTVTVLNDNNMRIRRFIGKWMDKIYGHSGNKMATSFVKAAAGSDEWSFTGDAHVQQYTKNGMVSSKYSMVQCWPTAMDPIDMNYDNTGTLQEYGVTFSMNYWTANHPTGSVV